MGGEGTRSPPRSPRSRRNKSVAGDVNLDSSGGIGSGKKKRRSKEGKTEISFAADEVNNNAPKSPRSSKRKSKFRAASGGSGSNRSLTDKDSIIPEDESFVPEDSPNLSWGTSATAKGKRAEGEGSSSTAATMDSSCGSLDSNGRKDKPDMDWGSHAKNSKINNNINSNSGHKQRELGGKGSGHKTKGAKKKKKDALSKGGSAHNERLTPKPKPTMRRSLSGGSLRLASEESTPSITKSPKKNKKKMDARPSALLQVIAMDASYNSPTNGGRKKATSLVPLKEESIGKARSFDEMVKMVKLGDDFTDSSSEEDDEEEDDEVEDLFEEDDDDDDSGEEQQQRKKAPKKKRQKAQRTRSHEDSRRRQSKKGSRSKGMRKSKTMDDTNAKRYQREIVPSTPKKSARKTRAQSMMVTKSPQSDDEEKTKEKRKERRAQQRMSIHEMNGLVTPRRQSRKSISRQQQPALPPSLDLGYGNVDDDESSRASMTNRSRGRRPSLGSALPRGDFHHQNNNDGSRQQKEGNRRLQGGGGLHSDGLIASSRQINNSLNALITPRRQRPKLAVPSPFDPDSEEESEEEKNDGLFMSIHSDMGDRTRTGGQHHRRRGSQLVQGGDDAAEEEADDPMSQSERGRRGSTSRRRRDLSRRASVNDNLVDDDSNHHHKNITDAMDLSSSRQRAGSRRSLMDNGASGRRPSRSLRGLDRLKGGDDEEEDNRTIGVNSLPEQQSKSKRKSVRTKRRDAVDDEAVGRRTSLTSNTRGGGRYGYGGDQGRLCLSAVPSTPKKSVGLAALLYCKPLDLGGTDEKEEDDSKSINRSADEGSNKSGSPTSVIDDVEDGDKQPIDKAKAKKDYWKAKLASGRTDSDRSLVVQ